MRKLQAGVVALVALATTASAPFQVERFELDKSHSYIGFSVKHLGVTNVRGKFNTFDGEILLDADDITKSTARITIDATSIDTNNERRDNDLRGEGFFEVAKYPKITFVGKRVDKTGDQLALVGDLTIRDVTRQVIIPFELSGPVESASGRKRLGAEGSFTIDRFDYGLQWNRMVEAVAVVAADVRIELGVEAATPRPPQATPGE